MPVPATDAAAPAATGATLAGTELEVAAGSDRSSLETGPPLRAVSAIAGGDMGGGIGIGGILLIVLIVYLLFGRGGL